MSPPTPSNQRNKQTFQIVEFSFHFYPFQLIICLEGQQSYANLIPEHSIVYLNQINLTYESESSHRNLICKDNENEN